jgi:AcrR family transcriptional regulator
MKSAGKRGYEMRSRAEAAAATGESILDATEELFWSMPVDLLSLDQIATLAGVTTQTIIRRFGGKDGVVAAAAERARARVAEQRSVAPVGDLPAAVNVLVDHYELFGDKVMRLLADEESSPTLKAIVEDGREFHRAWTREVFAPTLGVLNGAERSRRLAQLVAVCDVYTWKLLRRDAALSRPQTELALTEMLMPLVEEK